MSIDSEKDPVESDTSVGDESAETTVPATSTDDGSAITTAPAASETPSEGPFPGPWAMSSWGLKRGNQSQD